MKHKYQHLMLNLFWSENILALLCLLFLLTGSFQTQAQYVYIPDPNFRAFLQDEYPGCMVGDNLDTTCNAVTSNINLYLDNLGISDLTGIRYFDNLTSLYSSDNPLQYITWFPPNLRQFVCDSCQLTTLPPLPSSIYYLDLDHNNIASLPPFPNIITDSIFYLYISDNPIACLPDLPTVEVFVLGMCNTNITCLPEGPVSYDIDNCSNPIPPECPLGYDCEQLYNVSGNSFIDLDDDCILDSGEPPLPYQIIEINGGQYYSITDSNGKYYFYGGMGDTYDLSQVNPYPVLWDLSCFGNQHTVEVINPQDTFNNRDFPNKILIDCPYNIVDIATALQRQCFSTNNYAVNYCNEGTDTSFNTYIEINFDPEVIPLSSTLPWSAVNGTLYTFDIGTLNPGQCGSFTITDSVSCDAIIGQTACVEAHIFPDSTCEELNALWDESSLKVSGICNAANDTIHYVVKNVGAGDMSNYRLAIIYEDDLLKIMDSVILNSGDSTEYNIPATGKTYRLEVEQVSFHPGSSNPRSFIELCGNPPYSLGKITTIAQDDEDPWVEIDCHEIINAYDPNDKQVQPAGVGTNHFITAADELDYIINFQNTGNDTAFKVVLIDTLDAAYLDITSLQVGPSSHPYDLSMAGEGVVKFTFNNIMLPDSNVNESASHGFVKFNIRQKPDNLPGTVINNFADIYFDFNSPVTTNTTFVTIELPQNIFGTGINEPLIFDKEYEASAWPNPFDNQFYFEINAVHEGANYHLVLQDLRGKDLLVSENFTTSLKSFSAGNLPDGVYIYKLFDESNLIATGKLVKQ